MATEPQTAFFSYSRDDSEFALRLAEDLKAAGANVWIDQLDLVGGQRWAQRVQEVLESCPRVVVILSPSSVTSTNAMDEVTFALDEKKTVIPVLHRDCKVPLRLRSLHQIDFRTDHVRGLKALLKALSVEPLQSIASAAPEGSKVGQAVSSDVIELPRLPDQERLEQDRRLAAEQARLEQEERERVAAAKARLARERERLLDEQSRPEQERKQAAEQTRLERERKQATEQARREQERKRAAEQAQLERERRQATAQERLEQERKQAAGWARLEQEHKRAAEEARLELEKAAEQARLEDERKRAVKSSPLPPVSHLPAWARIAIPACVIVIVALALYWASSRSRPTEKKGETQKEQAPANMPNPQDTGESGAAKGAFSQPLSVADIVTLLQASVPDSRIEKLVKEHGIAFVMSPKIEQELRSHGPSENLVHLLIGQW